MQVILSGLSVGAIYGLVGMGFAIAFYVTRVINFAQGQLLMVSVMVTAALASSGWAPWLAVIVGIVFASLGGLLTYVVAVRPVLAFDRFSFAWLVSTLGVAVVLENIAALIWGPTSRPFPSLLYGTPLHILGATISLQEGLAIIVGVALALGFELVRRTTLFGKVGMAVAYDPEMTSAIGVNTTAVAVGGFILAGLFAGIAGELIGPITYANPYLGNTYGIDGFVALMIGGTERPVAAMAGGLLLGLAGQAANQWINPQASDWFPFVIVVVVLLVTPEGLFSWRTSWRNLQQGLLRVRQAAS
jgi:branched-chain amino acid transport system permease protein